MRLARLVAVAVLVAAGCGSSTASAIGIQSVHATPEFRVPQSPSEVAIFVETGSDSDRCLATLNELQGDSTVRMLFCGPRTATFDGGSTHVVGVWLHVFFAADPGERLDLWVNVYQAGGEVLRLSPVLLDGAGLLVGDPLGPAMEPCAPNARVAEPWADTDAGGVALRPAGSRMAKVPGRACPTSRYARKRSCRRDRVFSVLGIGGDETTGG